MQISRKDDKLNFEDVSSTSLWNIQGEVLDGPKEISARGRFESHPHIGCN